jgi:DNA-binding transcriptional ArsR family regulator
MPSSILFYAFGLYALVYSTAISQSLTRRILGKLVLADGTLIRDLIKLLSKHPKGCTVKEIIKKSKISRSQFYYCSKPLLEQGLIEKTKGDDGKTKLYRLKSTPK